jgi:hypothetical protein
MPGHQYNGSAPMAQTVSANVVLCKALHLVWPERVEFSDPVGRRRGWIMEEAKAAAMRRPLLRLKPVKSIPCGGRLAGGTFRFTCRRSCLPRAVFGLVEEYPVAPRGLGPV